MRLDIGAIVEQPLIQSAVNLCESLSTSGRFRTPYLPKLLQDLIEVAVDCPEKPENFKVDIGPIQGSALLDKICLVSGGADSTIAWHLYNKPQGIYIDIGQPYASKEIYNIQELEIPTYYVDLHKTDLGSPGEDWKHIIPGRNFLFLTIAAEFLKDKGKLIFAVTEGEGWNSGKGDKSEKFISMWVEWYRQLTGKIIHVETLISNTKAGWLKWFIQSGYDINIIRHKTITCFSETKVTFTSKNQCGSCQACLRKFLSFLNNNIDISQDFEIHPMIGAIEYVIKYKRVLKEALDKNDFSHYSKRRCEEDLTAIEGVKV